MNKKASISIITINLNNSEGLLKTIQSVVNQDCSIVEFIIIDGGSSDGSIEIIENYTAQIDKWVSKPDKGVYDAMNKGISLAKGEFILFMNSGDIFPKDALNLVAESINVFPEFDLFYGKANYLSESSSTLKNFNLNKVSLYKQMICHQAIVCKKNLFEKHGLFDLSYKIKADYEWLMRVLFQNIKCKKIDASIANYKQGGLSDQYYNVYSVKEIPLIRDKYYSATTQKFLRRFVFNGKIKNSVFFPFYLRLAEKLISPFINRKCV